MNKSLDDPQLAYEKRQKLEIQCSQLKTEVDGALKQYRLLVEQTGMLQRAHYTKTGPKILQRLEKLESDRMSHTKTTYSKYVANTHTVIPTVRELCDRLIHYTDQISPPNQVSQFVHSILFSLKEPLKPPKVPRFKPFGDANDSDTEDETIATNFHQTIFSIHSSYHDIATKDGSNVPVVDAETGTRHEPKPVQNDSEQLQAPAESTTLPKSDSDDFVEPEVTPISIDDTEVAKEEPQPTDVTQPKETPQDANIPETNTDNGDTLIPETNNDTKDAPKEQKEHLGGWVDDFLSSGGSGTEEFSVPSSKPFADSANVMSKKPLFQHTAPKSPRNVTEKAELPFEQPKSKIPSQSPRKQEERTLEPEKAIEPEVTPKETEDDTSVEGMKAKLKQKVQENDYYQLFGVTSSDTLATITQKRKELNKSLHPDNFVPNSAEKEAAVAKLVRINDVYNSVFRNQKTKTLYDKLCAYRKKYDTLLDSPRELLQRAVTNLNLVGKAVKRANLPTDLLDEVSLLLKMIEEARGIVPQ